MAQRSRWNKPRWASNNNERLTQPNPKKDFVPRQVLMRSSLKDVDTVKTNKAVPKGTARPADKDHLKPYKFAHKS